MIAAPPPPSTLLGLPVPFSLLSFLSFLSVPSVVSGKRKPRRGVCVWGEVPLPALPITSHMNLSFPIHKTETLIIPAHACAGPRGCGSCGEHPYIVTSPPEQSCEVGGFRAHLPDGDPGAQRTRGVCSGSRSWKTTTQTIRPHCLLFPFSPQGQSEQVILTRPLHPYVTSAWG